MDCAPNPPPQTGDPVDRLLETKLECARRGSERPVTVVVTELDDLDPLAAELGICGVDRILDVVAARLATLRAVDSVRTGNSFVSMSRAPRSKFDALSLADRIARTVARAAAVETLEISLRASIGVCHASVRRARYSRMLRREAQFALDEAKQRGGGTIVLFSRDLYRRRTSRLWAVGTRFEPIVSMDDGVLR